jgi:hypothetical protein
LYLILRAEGDVVGRLIVVSHGAVVGHLES